MSCVVSLIQSRELFRREPNRADHRVFGNAERCRCRSNERKREGMLFHPSIHTSRIHYEPNDTRMQALRYVRAMPKTEGVPLESLFPGANPLGTKLRLLDLNFAYSWLRFDVCSRGFGQENVTLQSMGKDFCRGSSRTSVFEGASLSRR